MAVIGTEVLLGVLAGAIAAGGLLLLGLALRGFPARPGKPTKKRSREDLVKTLTTRTAIAIISGALVLIVTRWVVAAGGISLLVLGWSSIAGGAGAERKAMARLEALAAWTESLRDTIAGAVGLEQAIPSSLRAASPILQEPLRDLVDRMHSRTPMPDALHRFADEIDDPSADLVIAALILNARLRGPGLREMLGALSTAARAELDMRRRVQADRSTTRRSVQIVVGFSTGMALLLALFNREYVEPYNSPMGQLVLVLVVGLFAIGFLWIRRLANYDMPERLLGGAPVAPAPEVAVPLRGRAAMDAGGGR